MKKTFSIIITGFLILASLASCTDNEIIPESMLQETEACCDNEGDIPPPPPPPPPGGSGG